MEVLESPGKILTLDKIKVQLESYQAFKQGKRIVVNQGGTRSGKTFWSDEAVNSPSLQGEVFNFHYFAVVSHYLRKGELRD